MIAVEIVIAQILVPEANIQVQNRHQDQADILIVQKAEATHLLQNVVTIKKIRK